MYRYNYDYQASVEGFLNFKWTLVISNITSISRSYNPLSSPASSLKRLRINYKPNLKNSYILISPTKEQEFIDTLKSINPNIEIDVPNTKNKWRIQDWDI